MGNINKITTSALAMVLWSSTATSQTLVEATSFAIGNSPDVAIIKNQYLSRVEQIGVSRAGYKPKVDLALGWGGEWTNNPTTRASTGSADFVDLERGEASLTMSQLLYDGLRTKNDNDRTTAEAEAHRFLLWDAAENTTLEVADVYMGVIHAQEEATLAAANLEAHINILNGIRKRSEYGLGSASDLSQVKGRLSRAHTNFLATENNVLDAKARYYKVVGQEALGLVKPEAIDQNMPIAYEQALERAGKVHPTLLSAQLDVDAAVAQLKTRDSDFHPDVRLELGGTWNNNIDGVVGYNNDLTAMIRMRYNLFNGEADSYRKKAAYYQLMEASAIRDRAQREVAEGMSLAWNAYQLLERQMEFLESHVIEAEKTQDAYQQQFSLGRRTLVDLLDAENELFEARRELLAADKDRILTQFRVLNAMGDLLTVLNLNRESVLTGEDKLEVAAMKD
ncbi:TolC family outer membrane protein [Amphritea sp. 1_MG-2023]|uniref:TolC family outer membrane protein n=1 Tax=Amphritea sp. 1_MG-2023 TaxID=3062670 RepID=UPI0026E33BB2|nr:TolC family outer membrane protein [Amphritea sp. 1_MG-2023]MDO6564943.1 TolC family outer membrane protein [Amphritea sp. 1_MG-2023]